MDGVIIVDKPAGWTSHDVVHKMRRLAQTRRVGHLGTLDPSATGVLPLVVGKATRLAQFYTHSDKLYEGIFHFGYSTHSYDSEGERTSPEVSVTLDREQLSALLARFQGKILQTPPAVSAKKIGGRPAHELVRKNVAVEMKPVEVEIYSLEILGIDGPEASVRVHCSAGTYIRSIAHDAGQALGCGAFLHSLRRLAAGEFRIENARTMEQLAALSAEGRLAEALLPAAQLLPQFPAQKVDAETEAWIRHGRDFEAPFEERYIKVLSAEGGLLAMGEMQSPGVYHPSLVF